MNAKDLHFRDRLYLGNIGPSSVARNLFRVCRNGIYPILAIVAIYGTASRFKLYQTSRFAEISGLDPRIAKPAISSGPSPVPAIDKAPKTWVRPQKGFLVTTTSSPAPNADIAMGRLLKGDPATFKRAYQEFCTLPVDEDTRGEIPALRTRQTTIQKPVSIEGPGTFLGKMIRKVEFIPTDLDGWWFDRTDHRECLPVRVSIRNVWTTGQIVSNIVLRSGPPQNYIRLVEHIIALRCGMDIDNVMIRIDSGDPPLFEQGSLDLVNILDEAGRVEIDKPIQYCTVKEPVSMVTPEGKFLTIEPVDPANPTLEVDCAVNFKTAIGKQRIKFYQSPEMTRKGSIARTNSTFQKLLYCKTVGKLFADVRNLGYDKKNVLIAGRFGYVNKARLIKDGKSLEAVWHRAVLDLLAAVALIENGGFLGKITSYKAGHSIDVEMIRLLYNEGLIVPFDPANPTGT